MKKVLIAILLLGLLPHVSADYIHWVDFRLSAPVLRSALELDMASQGGEQPLDWIDILALAAAWRGGTGVTVADTQRAAQALRGDTPPERLPGMAGRCFSYYRAAYGAALGGLEVHVRSDVAPGSGLSSSAAFEVLLARVLNALFCGGRLSPIELAQISQRAENVYFGKPCGLMDQLVSSMGGLVYIDFADPAQPAAERVSFDFSHCGHALCIVSCGADHANLTADYAAIPDELARVCAVFGKTYLREVDEEDFCRQLPAVRAAAGDRAVLRAMHVYDENRRVRAEVQALRAGDFARFLALVNASGDSSWEYLQNITPAGAAARQDMALTLALCRRLLAGTGAVRVHGGGFAGTALSIVPEERIPCFTAGLERALAPGCCRVLRVE